MAAKSKSDLLEITVKEFNKFNKLIDSIDAEVAMKKRDENTSIKDVVAHRAHWIGLFLGWYADGIEEKTVYFPAEGYKWNDLKRYNSDLKNSQSNMGWSEAVTMFQQQYQALIEFIENHSNQELYDGPMKGANNAWTPGRWAEAAGPSHFRSASKFIRTALKNK